jgi:hypothetical protein
MSQTSLGITETRLRLRLVNPLPEKQAAFNEEDLENHTTFAIAPP